MTSQYNVFKPQRCEIFRTKYGTIYHHNSKKTTFVWINVFIRSKGRIFFLMVTKLCYDRFRMIKTCFFSWNIFNLRVLSCKSFNLVVVSCDSVSLWLTSHESASLRVTSHESASLWVKSHESASLRVVSHVRLESCLESSLYRENDISTSWKIFHEKK